MKEPITPEEVSAFHKLLRTDPQRYLRIVNEWIAENPRNSHAYFDRHFAWMDLGEPHRALDDLNKVIELEPEPVAFIMRGEVYRFLGEYQKAVADYAHAEAMDPAEWQDNGFCLLYQADAHAHLGNEAAALACCARLRDDFWTPGMNNTPSGGKAEICRKAAPRRGRCTGKAGLIPVVSPPLEKGQGGGCVGAARTRRLRAIASASEAIQLACVGSWIASSLSLLAMTRRYPPPRSETERGRGTMRSMVEGACGRSARSSGERASVFVKAPPTALRAVPPRRCAGRDDRRMLQNLTA